MVKFIVERTPSNVRGLDKYQMRNDWNDDVKFRSDDLPGLAARAFKYCANQDDELVFDLLQDDYATLAKALGSDTVNQFGNFDIGI